MRGRRPTPWEHRKTIFDQRSYGPPTWREMAFAIPAGMLLLLALFAVCALLFAVVPGPADYPR